MHMRMLSCIVRCVFRHALARMSRCCSWATKRHSWPSSSRTRTRPARLTLWACGRASYRAMRRCSICGGAATFLTSRQMSRAWPCHRPCHGPDRYRCRDRGALTCLARALGSSSPLPTGGAPPWTRSSTAHAAHSPSRHAPPRSDPPRLQAWQWRWTQRWQWRPPPQGWLRRRRPFPTRRARSHRPRSGWATGRCSATAQRSTS